MKVAVLGLGNVGTNFIRILMESREHLEKSCGDRIEVAFAGDSRHLVEIPPGTKPKAILDAKASGDISKDFRETHIESILSSDIDAVVDISSASKDGQREKVIYRTAFQNGINVITANKSPLALHWSEIMPEAQKRGMKILYEATVAGGVPLFNFVKYSCGPSRVHGFHGIVSLTANFVLKMMLDGKTFEQAVRIAQDMGVAETDYTDDTSGLDSARKTVIVANSLFGKQFTLKDISYTGIPELSEKEIRENGSMLRLISEISDSTGELEVSTGFRLLEKNDYLLTLGESSLGYEINTDNNGILRVASAHDGPRETASGVMNDVLLLARDMKTH